MGPEYGRDIYKASVAKWGAKSDAEWSERARAFTQSKKEMHVLLDHAGSFSHAEVFYAVAGLVLQLLPGNDITFYVCTHFAEKTGMMRLWNKVSSAIRSWPTPMLTHAVR
jgi:hypothetical protein